MGEETSVLNVETWSEVFNENGIEMVTDRPFLNEIWEDRPAAPKGKIYPVPTDFAGFSVAEKIEQVREQMREHGLILIYWVEQMNPHGCSILKAPMCRHAPQPIAIPWLPWMMCASYRSRKSDCGTSR